MINIRDIIEVEIEKITFGGSGLARVGEEKFVVFVDNCLPKDKLKVQIISKTKKFARAKTLEVIESKRIKPMCALYNACGACDNQLCDYDETVEIKSDILKDIFSNIIEPKKIHKVIKSPSIEEYRKKIQYPCSETKNSKRILMGYYKNKTHDLTNIKFCPLVPKSMNEISQFIRDNFPLNCYNEKTHTGTLRHVLARFNLEDEALITFVLNDTKASKKLNQFSLKLMEEFKNIKGVFVNFNTEKTNKILGNTTLKIHGDNYIIESLEDKKFKIGATSFFQVNPKSANNLFKIVKDNIKQNSTVLDAYGGVGAIGIYACEKIKKITLVEQNLEAISLAKENYELNNIKDYEILSGDASSHFKKFKDENKTFDYVILDPPRFGCTKEGLEEISKIAKNIIYVSCDPSTLRRDLGVLKELGFKEKELFGVDLFPYTHHIESVLILEKA